MRWGAAWVCRIVVDRFTQHLWHKERHEQVHGQERGQTKHILKGVVWVEANGVFFALQIDAQRVV